MPPKKTQRPPDTRTIPGYDTHGRPTRLTIPTDPNQRPTVRPKTRAQKAAAREAGMELESTPQFDWRQDVDRAAKQRFRANAAAQAADQSPTLILPEASPFPTFEVPSLPTFDFPQINVEMEEAPFTLLPPPTKEEQLNTVKQFLLQLMKWTHAEIQQKEDWIHDTMVDTIDPILLAYPKETKLLIVPVIEGTTDNQFVTTPIQQIITMFVSPTQEYQQQVLHLLRLIFENTNASWNAFDEYFSNPNVFQKFDRLDLIRFLRLLPLVRVDPTSITSRIVGDTLKEFQSEIDTRDGVKPKEPEEPEDTQPIPDTGMLPHQMHLTLETD